MYLTNVSFFLVFFFLACNAFMLASVVLATFFDACTTLPPVLVYKL